MPRRFGALRRITGSLGIDLRASALRLASLGLIAAILGGLFLLASGLLIVGRVLSPALAYVIFGASLFAFFVVVGGALLGLSSLALSRVAWVRVLCSSAILLGVTALALLVRSHVVP